MNDISYVRYKDFRNKTIFFKYKEKHDKNKKR